MRLGWTVGLGLLLTQAAWAQNAPAQQLSSQSVTVPAASPAVPAIAPVQPANPLQPVITPPPTASVQPNVLSA
jgi:hypothetical protein